MSYSNTMNFVNKTAGKYEHGVLVKPIKPFETTVIRGSPNFSEDG